MTGIESPPSPQFHHYHYPRSRLAMRCFGGHKSTEGTPSSPSTTHPPPPQSQTRSRASVAGEEEEDEEGKNSRTGGGGGDESPISTSTSAAASPATINLLTREYTLAVQTNSYNEIWTKIHHINHNPGGGGGGGDEGEGPQDASPAHLIDSLLHPDRESIQQVLRTARPSNLTRLVSDYFDSSEHTTHLCLLLSRSIDRARSIYKPLHDLLDLLPTTTTNSPSASAAAPPPPQQQQHLSQSQCDWAFDTFLEFDRLENPFPSSAADDDGGGGGGCSSFSGMRCCFAELRLQLDHRLLKARRRHRLMRRATQGSALCLMGSTVGLVVTGVVIATHALAAIAMAPAFFFGYLTPPTRDLLAGPRRRVQEHMAQLDAAARGTYVLNNDLDTIERLVAWLHARVQSDKELVRLGLDRGRGHRHPVEEVVRQLRKNHPSFLHHLRDLDEHVCLCFAAVNRARSLLLHQIHNS